MSIQQAAAMTDNRFEPINKEHAIVEVVFFFEFAQGLDDQMDRLIPLRKELSDIFPSNDFIEVFEMSINGEEKTSNTKTKIGGIELRRFKENGNLDWMIRISTNFVSIHCMEYAGWEDVWNKINSYAGKILEKLAGSNVNISAIGLKYVDQFIFHGNTDEYDISHLFKENNSLINPRAFNSSGQWHCHSGWFENTEELGSILSQMNIDSLVQSPETIVIVIDNTLIRRADTIDGLGAYRVPNQSGANVRSILANCMHDINKHLLGELLVDVIQQRINLYGGE
jgi:uncharacterized protein (TIGR04255 family)